MDKTQIPDSDRLAELVRSAIEAAYQRGYDAGYSHGYEAGNSMEQKKQQDYPENRTCDTCAGCSVSERFRGTLCKEWEPKDKKHNS